MKFSFSSLLFLVSLLKLNAFLAPPRGTYIYINIRYIYIWYTFKYCVHSSIDCHRLSPDLHKTFFQFNFLPFFLSFLPFKAKNFDFLLSSKSNYNSFSSSRSRSKSTSSLSFALNSVKDNNRDREVTRLDASILDDELDISASPSQVENTFN